MAPKRKAAQEGIAAALSKAQAAANRKKLPDLECEATIRTVPQDYVEELNKHYAAYIEERASKEAQLQHAAEVRTNAVSGSAPTPPTAAPPSAGASLNLDEFDPTADHAAALAASRWQKKALYCVERAAAWAGTEVALQSALQEKLVTVMLNHSLHPDPILSLKAYQLLQQNLQQHPPVKPAPISAGQPYVLELNKQCWNLLDFSSQPIATLILADSAKPGASFSNATAFSIVQNLVADAVLLVTGNENSSNILMKEPSGAKASQGKALTLLYLVQLLQADCNARLAVFEQHMALTADSSNSMEDVAEIRRRAATVLQHSLLFRLMETDLGWSEDAADTKGKHRLVRDLVLLVTTDLDYTADVVPPPTPPPAGTAGGSSTPGPAEAAAAAVTAAVQPVSPPELVSAARRLLLLMLELYSNCEAAGVYGGGSRLHSKRSADKDSDRCWVDLVVMKAIGALGAGHMLQGLKDVATGPAALERLLQFLPPVHRVRLAAMSVAVSIHRGHDPNPQAVDPLEAVHNYYDRRGRGNVDLGPEFVRSSALDVASALTARQWVVKELLGGKEAPSSAANTALLLASLVQAALTGRQLQSATEEQQFKKLMKPILELVQQKAKAGLAKECTTVGYSVVVFSVGSAMQLLSS